MRFVSAYSEAETAGGAAEELCGGCEGVLPGTPDLACLFFTAALLDEAAELVETVRRRLSPRVLLGTSCESVIGSEREIERRPGAALLLGSLPGVELRPFHVQATEWSALLADDDRLRERVAAGAEHRGHVLLADPFTTPMEPLLRRLDAVLDAPTVGGVASAAQRPGGNALVLDGRLVNNGVVGLGLGGALRLDTVVSQGCRPIGQPFVITKVHEHEILELGRRPALDVAQDTVNALSPGEQQLLRSGLFVGVVINEYQARFDRGDFLVRGLMGVNPETRGLVIGDHVRPGQTIQFHLRDAATAHEDLTELLEPQRLLERPAGALLFSCNGRGQRMFETPHHDATTTRALLGEVPLAGFFAMGELGPVGGRSFIHGHTASMALFRSP